MRKKGKKNFEVLKIIMLFIIVSLIAIIIIATSIKKITFEEEISEVQIQKNIEENNKKIESDVIKSKLSEKKERDRIEYYVSVFIREIESRNYNTAYMMLYEDFRENYFPTLSEFEEYAKKTFPKSMALNHVNIERSSNTYVLYVEISDLLASKDSEIKEMKFVVRENDLNDFDMSFSVI